MPGHKLISAVQGESVRTWYDEDRRMWRILKSNGERDHQSTDVFTSETEAMRAWNDGSVVFVAL